MTTAWMQKYWVDFVALFYPRNCPGCGADILDNGRIICWNCINRLPFTGFETRAGNLVEHLFAGRLPFECAFSLLFFSKNSLVQQLVHAVKYRGNQELGLMLGAMMGHAVRRVSHSPPFDLVIPMPLSNSRLARRGFNQAALLAEGISSVTDLPVISDAVERLTFKDTQTRKSREARWENVGDVFRIRPANSLENKHILLVDDVVTTGATLEACGQVLLQTPGIKVSIATLAFASVI